MMQEVVNYFFSSSFPNYQEGSVMQQLCSEFFHVVRNRPRVAIVTLICNQLKITAWNMNRWDIRHTNYLARKDGGRL